MIPQKQPSGFREGLNLYQYQLDAVTWMKSVEDDICNERDFSYCHLVPWRSAKSDILWDSRSGEFVTYADVQKSLTAFIPKGGILADEVCYFN